MKRSKHSLSNYKLATCDMGDLVPVGLTEVLPGDSIQQATSALVRMSPLLAPVMHPTHATIHHFFVPHRIIWDEWEDFITGGPDGMDASVFPTITMPVSGGAAVGSLADYLGVPTGINSLEVSALPFRAYAMIWNEWFRDQDLQTTLVIDETSGPDTTTSTALQNVAWEKDYFTTSRPWTQKGPEVTIPLTGDADVIGSGLPVQLKGGIGGTSTTAQFYSGTGNYVGTGGASVAGTDVYFGNETGLIADLSGVTSASVNDLRLALALQRYEEARARYGSRYTEYLRYLGVKSSDARLQRPEYLGGGKQTIQFSEVLQTSSSDDDQPLGQLGGHGIGALRSNRYRRFFEEHGYVITLMSIKPKTMYMDGLPRTWNRRTKEDFWQKELEHIGQQEVLNKEVQAGHTTPNGVFGYQDRYDEYRRIENTVSGQFRTVLDFWHFARQLPTNVALNADFVKSVPTKDPFAVPSEDVVYIMVQHSIQARRLISAKGTSFTF